MSIVHLAVVRGQVACITSAVAAASAQLPAHLNQAEKAQLSAHPNQAEEEARRRAERVRAKANQRSRSRIPSTEANLGHWGTWGSTGGALKGHGGHMRRGAGSM